MSWYSIQANEDDLATISIHDEIGGFGISANQFMRDLDAIGDRRLHLSIHSPGGSVLDGWAIYNRLLEHKRDVTAKVEGYAGSMASVILLAANHRVMPENSWQMIHYPYAAIQGTAEEMANYSEQLAKIEKGIVAAYVKRTGLEESEIRDMLKKESFLSAEESEAFGFADEVTEGVAMAACSDWNLPSSRPKNFQIAAKAKPINNNQPDLIPMDSNKDKPEAPAINVKEVRDQERARIAEISAIGQRFRVAEKEINDAIDGGKDVNDFRKEVTDNFNPEKFNNLKVDGGSNDSAFIDDKDVKQFSVAKAMRETLEGRGLTGVEREVQDELSSRFMSATGKAPEGFLLPANLTHGEPKATHTVTTGTAGGNTVFDEPRPLLDQVLYDYSLMDALGVTTFRDATGNLSFPRLTADLSGTWDAETDTISPADMTFATNLSMSPKRVGAMTGVSKQLLLQSNEDIEAFVNRRIAQALGRAIDRGAITGSGSSDQPAGVLSASGTDSYTWVTGSSCYVNIVDQWKDLRDNSVAMANVRWLADEAVAADWMKEPKESGQAIFCLEGNPGGLQYALGFPFYTHVDVTNPKVILGDFSEAAVAFWGGIEVIVDPYSKKNSGYVEIAANAFADVGLLQPTAFVIGNDGTDHA